jgi:hypothetical protein
LTAYILSNIITILNLLTNKPQGGAMGNSEYEANEEEQRIGLLKIIGEHIPICPGGNHPGLKEEFEISDTEELKELSAEQLEKVAVWIEETFQILAVAQ